VLTLPAYSYKYYFKLSDPLSSIHHTRLAAECAGGGAYTPPTPPSLNSILLLPTLHFAQARLALPICVHTQVVLT
jgi:hypothetical protein